MQEKRKEPRYPINNALRVADVTCGQLPHSEAFYRVLGADISRTGASFTTWDPVDGEVVFALGNPPDLTYVIGRVAHCGESYDNASQLFRVGCEFTGRATPDSTGQLVRQEGATFVLASDDH